MSTSRPIDVASDRAGFTLIEVVVALTILAMITGTLFAVVQGSVRGASEIELLQREKDAINRLQDVCRRTFATMPSSATITLELLDGSGDAQEMTITGVPNCFGFGLQPISYSETVIGLRPDLEGRTDESGNLLQSLSISREDLIPETEDNQMALGQDLTGALAPDEEGRTWMPLLPDVISLKWRVFQLAEDTWFEEWDEAEWPDLIELQLVMKDRVTPIRMVFGVPTLDLAPGSGGSGGGNNPPQGGGNPGGGGQ